MNILDAMSDPALFGRWFRSSSWDPWRAFLAALFGHEMTAEQRQIYEKHTKRTAPPTSPAREAWVICGRRAGKSRVAALLAVFLACFRDYRKHLAPGEVATVMVIAADRKQARVVFRYVKAFLAEVPMLRKLIANETRESIELTTGCAIEIHTGSYKSTRGYTCVGVIADECAFWSSDSDGANPDAEVIAALRPALATIPGALLLGISSPYSRRGVLWKMHQRHHGVDGSPVLTWQARSDEMNPTLKDSSVIAEAYEEDPQAADAEWGGNFRSDLESYVAREVAEANRVPGRFELPPVDGVRHHGFIDPSGGSRDSFTMAIAHHDRETDRVTLDCIRERRPPFNPDDVVKEFAAVLASYGISTVKADHYAGAWVTSKCAEHGITCEQSAEPKSQLYLSLLPLLNSGRVELLDHARCINQLCALERRTSRGGRDSVDHPPNGHDDVINAVAGAIALAKETSIQLVAPQLISAEHSSPWSGRRGGWGYA